jgi:hypothetical protein
MITSLYISKDNLQPPCDCVGVHNPLVFFVTCEYNGELPESLLVNIFKDFEPTPTKQYRALPYDFPTANTIRYRFDGAAAIRSIMPDYGDEDQLISDGWKAVGYANRPITLTFIDPVTIKYALLQLFGVHAARQSGQTEAATEIYNNDNQTYIGYVGSDVYMYVWAEAGALIQSGTLSEVVAEDYNGTDFEDYDGQLFTINTI